MYVQSLFKASVQTKSCSHLMPIIDEHHTFPIEKALTSTVRLLPQPQKSSDLACHFSGTRGEVEMAHVLGSTSNNHLAFEIIGSLCTNVSVRGLKSLVSIVIK